MIYDILDLEAYIAKQRKLFPRPKGMDYGMPQRVYIVKQRKLFPRPKGMDYGMPQRVYIVK